MYRKKMTDFKQHEKFNCQKMGNSTKFDITMKIKSIDQWKRLNCVISKETYDLIINRITGWNPQGPLSVWIDKSGTDHYFLKIKLSQWDTQPCNFHRMEKYIGRNVSASLYAKEYSFRDDTSPDASGVGVLREGWSATLASQTIRIV